MWQPPALAQCAEPSRHGMPQGLRLSADITVMFVLPCCSWPDHRTALRWSLCVLTLRRSCTQRAAKSQKPRCAACRTLGLGHTTCCQACRNSAEFVRCEGLQTCVQLQGVQFLQQVILVLSSMLCRAVSCPAQAAMSSNEAQVRAEAAASCERLAAEYESRMAHMAAELDRTRQELAIRTHTLGSELSR